MYTKGRSVVRFPFTLWPHRPTGYGPTLAVALMCGPSAKENLGNGELSWAAKHRGAVLAAVTNPVYFWRSL